MISKTAGGAERASPMEWMCGKASRAAGLLSLALSLILVFAAPSLAQEVQEAAHEAAGLNGAELGVVWAIPFVGILLSIALFPLLAPHFWHHHFGKVALFWALAFIIPFAMGHDGTLVVHELAHMGLLDYVPFLILLGALFTIAGGIFITGNLHGRPRFNVSFLAVGAALASIVGTTGASMVLIRPVLRANDGRRHNVHVVVFFIFLVSNIGGSLTPLGDPPLFLGYLRGVDFFWTTAHMFAETALCVFLLLGLFWLIDRRLYNHDEDFRNTFDPTPDTGKIGIRGKVNILLLLVVVGGVLLSGSWRPGISYDVLGIELGLQDIARDVILVLAALTSLAVTPKGVRESNGFNWEPILEVAKLFAAIFVTIIPVIAMLRAAHEGAFAPLVEMVSRPDGSPINAMYFWMTGLLSSFLDNAPTYLVFFNLAGGDAQHLMGPLARTLAAISCGAVFMGANSYIGNAPNFMVKSIAESSGIKMPSFFGYMMWSMGILVPLFAIVTVVFFLF